MCFHLSLSLNSDLARIPMVRRVCRDALNAGDLERTLVDDMETLVGELATNAVLHSGSTQYQVTLELLERQIIVTVSDQGNGFRRDAVVGIGTERTAFWSDKDLAGDCDDSSGLRFGGWGLPLVEALADTVEYVPVDPHGTMIRATKTWL